MSTFKTCLRVLLVAAALLSNTAIAHDLGVAQIIISRVGSDDPNPQKYRLQAKLANTVSIGTPSFSGNQCRIGNSGVRTVNRFTQAVEIAFFCPAAGNSAQGNIIVPWQVEGAVVVIKNDGGTRHSEYIAAEADGIAIPMQFFQSPSTGFFAIGGRYFVLGFEHILSGIDHILFLLCLCILASGWHLFRLVTAFTVGHSVTLAAASLGWVTIPSLPVEACIALSIVLLARTAALQDQRLSGGFCLIVGFGLLHGLGFAGALAELGLEPAKIPTALLFFNMGIEIGQIIFIIFSMILFNFIQIYTFSWQYILNYNFSIVIGSIGIYWFFQRVMLILI